MNAAPAPTLSSEIQAHLDQAVRDGIAHNVERWLRFRGHAPGEWFELQALEVPDGRYEENRFAHVADAATATRLLEESERWGASGVYHLANQIDAAVATRRKAGRWHYMKTGQSTTDSEVEARRILFIDLDARRPKKTSATDAQVTMTHEAAVRVYHHLSSVVAGGPSSIAIGHSGNGRSLFLALNNLREGKDVEALVKGVIACVAALYSSPTVEIDGSVCDAKRLVPAFGTTKRKGAPGLPEYPHRRTGLWVPDVVHRLSQVELEALLAALRTKLTVEQNAYVDKAMGKRPSATATGGPREPAEVDPFAVANREISIREVVQWLGLLNGDHVQCPGCGLSGDSSVAIVGNGVKCSHARCAAKGAPGREGFRSLVDVVIEARGCSAGEALGLLRDQWPGVIPDGSTQKRQRQGGRVVNFPGARRQAEPVTADASVLLGLAERIKETPRGEKLAAALDPAILSAAASLAPTQFLLLREQLKGAGVSVGSWEKAVAGERARAAAAERHTEEQRHGDAALQATPSWKDQLLYRNTKDGRTLDPVAANVIAILAHDPDWDGVVAFDELEQSIVSRKSPPWGPLEAPPAPRLSAWEDSDAARLQAWLRRRYSIQLSLDAIWAALSVVADRRRFSPVVEWLDTLQHDGTARVQSWLSTYLGVEDTEYSRMVGQLFLVSSVARARMAGCKVDTLPIFEGKQGVKKSSALKVLFGQWFRDTPLDLASKDRFMALRGVWGYEIAEIDGLNRHDASAIKAFMSSPQDDYRPPYGRALVRAPRRCVFAGTVNPGREYLLDETGGRRFWPIHVATRGEIDLEGLERDRAQLWAEADWMFTNGEKWWPEGGENGSMEDEQAARQARDAWEVPIAEWLDQVSGRPAVKLSEVLEWGLRMEKARWDQKAQERAGKCLRALGWRRVRDKGADLKTGVRGYHYVRPAGG